VTLLQPQPVGIPLPKPSPLTQPFWDGCAAGELRYQECAVCARAIFDPARACRFCGATELGWRTSAGHGEVYSWSTVWRPQTPAFVTPYVAAIVALGEGFHMVSNIVGCEIDAVHTGLPVEVVFHSAGALTLPYFRPR